MGPGKDEVLKLNPSTNERTHSEEGNTSTSEEDADETKKAVSRPVEVKTSDSEEYEETTANMSNSRLEPPEFCTDASGYAEYKKRLLRWSRITSVNKKQQAEVVKYTI